MINPIIRIGAALVLAVLASARTSLAHEGHDHGAEAPLVATPATLRTTASSELFELVAVGNGSELVVYVDRFSTNLPIESATLEIETPDGPRVAEAIGDAYRLSAPWLLKPGQHDLIFTVTSTEGVEVLTATMSVPEPAPIVAAASYTGLLANLATRIGALAGGRQGERQSIVSLGAAGGLAIPAQRAPDGAIFAPKQTQRILAIRTDFTTIDTHATAVELPGRIIPDPNASGYVQASISGRLSPPPGGFARLGTIVKPGDILAFVLPPLTSAESSDQRQRQGELDQQIAITERRIARFEQLDRTRAVARSQLEESRLELQGLRDRRAALDRFRREPEALIAPVAGVVAAANAIAGQIADTNAIIFHIIDPTRLWVEALSFSPPAPARRASARDAQGRVHALVHEGTGLADRNQAIAMQLSIAGSTNGLRPGQFVTVLIETEDTRSGVAVPRTSVVRGANGQSFVFEHVAAERFEPREVRIEPLDGRRVLIAAGLQSGKRVVTQGAELLNQIR